MYCHYTGAPVSWRRGLSFFAAGFALQCVKHMPLSWHVRRRLLHPCEKSRLDALSSDVVASCCFCWAPVRIWPCKRISVRSANRWIYCCYAKTRPELFWWFPHGIYYHGWHEVLLCVSYVFFLWPKAPFAFGITEALPVTILLYRAPWLCLLGLTGSCVLKLNDHVRQSKNKVDPGSWLNS